MACYGGCAVRRIVFVCALLLGLGACASAAAPTPTAVPPSAPPTAAAPPTAGAAGYPAPGIGTAVRPTPPPALSPTAAPPSPLPTGVPGTRTPQPSPSPAPEKPPPRPTPAPERTAPTPPRGRPVPASGYPAPGTGYPAAGNRAATSGPRATPVRVGGAQAQQVASAPGPATYATGPGGLYRLEGGQPTLVQAGPPPPNLLAVDADRLVSGEAPGCMRDTPGAPLRRSRDGGKTWEEASGPTGRGFRASPRLVRGDEVFALYCAGVLWSQDGGKTYAAVPSLSTPNYDPWDLALAPDGNAAYVAAVSEGGTLQVLRATRSGKSWGAAAKIDDGWGGAALAVAPDGRVLLGTARGVKTSTDRGATWQELRSGLEDATLSGDPVQGTLGPADEQKLRAGVGITDFAFLGTTPLAATHQGVYRLSGSRWERWSDVATRVDRLEVDDGTVYATTTSGVVALRP